MSQFSTSSQIHIQIAKTPLGSGGEGMVYEVTYPNSLKNRVVKIFHPRERDSKKLRKVNYLITHKPDFLNQSNTIAWPEEIVFQDGVFVGYLMPKASQSYDLTTLCALNFSRKLDKTWKTQFSRQTSKGLFSRICLAYQLAFTVHQLHQTGQYILVDLKPENVRIDLDGSITIIDIDSIEVIENQQLLFAAEKITGEYSPAELKVLDKEVDIIPETWDNFSLAVVIYKLLLGLHPFTSTPKGKFAHLNGLEQKIQEGLFPFGKKGEDLKVVPELHQGLSFLPTQLKVLFYQCFDQGYENPDLRPTAWDWASATAKIEIQELKALEKYHIDFNKKTQRKKKISPQINNPEAVNSDKIPRWIAALTMILSLSLMYYLSETWSNHSQKKLYQSTKLSLNTIEINNKFGFVDQQGNLIIPCEYDKVFPFKGKFAKVVIDDKFGYINKNNDELIPCKYAELDELHVNRNNPKGGGKTLIRVKNDYKYQLLYQDGTVASFEYDSIGMYSSGLVPFKQLNRYGYLDASGKEVIPAQYDQVFDFSKNQTRVLFDGDFGLIDAQGEEIIPAQYEYLGDVQGECAYCQKKWKVWDD